MSDIKVKKRLSKKAMIIWGIVLFIILKIIFSIVSPFFMIPGEIKELNKNINLPYKFAYPVEDYEINKEEWKSYDEVDYSYCYMDNDEYFLFDRFPDLSSTHKFVYFTSSNKKYSVFGINVGDSMDYVNRILRKKGYDFDKYDEDGIKYDIEYEKGRVTINIMYNNSVREIEIPENQDYEDEFNEEEIQYVDEMVVEEISISLNSTDWFHKGYYK